MALPLRWAAVDTIKILNLNLNLYLSLYSHGPTPRQPYTYTTNLTTETMNGYQQIIFIRTPESFNNLAMHSLHKYLSYLNITLDLSRGNYTDIEISTHLYIEGRFPKLHKSNLNCLQYIAKQIHYHRSRYLFFKTHWCVYVGENMFFFCLLGQFSLSLRH